MFQEYFSATRGDRRTIPGLKKFSETKSQDFYSYLPKEKFPLLRYFGSRMIAIFGSTYECE
jgi:hypothetical protein